MTSAESEPLVGVLARPVTVITGSSRGIGAALARRLIESGHELLCISRSTNPDLKALAQAAGVRCTQWEADFATDSAVPARLEAWLACLEGQIAAVSLINNAGLLPHIAPIGEVPAEDVSKVLRVNLELPMLLTGAFLRATSAWQCRRKVLNISSGLGRIARASQATYSASKAGLDHFTRCVAAEEEARTNGALLCSMAPGSVDTGMQAQLRETSAASYAARGHHIEMNASGRLASADETAAKILAWLDGVDYGKQVIVDIKTI